MEKMEEGAKLKAADIIMKNAAKDQTAGTAVPEDGTAAAENGTAKEQNICDDALERLQKLRGMAKNDDETESEAADLPDEAEAAEEEAAADTDGEEGGEDAAEDGREDSEMDADEKIREMTERLACYGEENSIPSVPRYYLELSASQAESLKEFIEDHLIDDIRNDPEVNKLDWIADMCEIWREMSKWHIKKSSD
jgi:hypothetical protein